MKYPNGDIVKLGDIVELWNDCQGEVVCSFDDDTYSKEYTKSDWGYLKRGVLIKSNQAGLIHYIEPETTMRMVTRK